MKKSMLFQDAWVVGDVGKSGAPYVATPSRETIDSLPFFIHRLSPPISSSHKYLLPSSSSISLSPFPFFLLFSPLPSLSLLFLEKRQNTVRNSYVNRFAAMLLEEMPRMLLETYDPQYVSLVCRPGDKSINGMRY